MRVRFWGTRGSIAKPGPATLRYGGNTSCVEVRAERHAGRARLRHRCPRAGPGAHGRGDAPRRGHLLIGHTHWDHIQGFPFFAPLFVPSNEWDIYAPARPRHAIDETLAGQMQYTYFPVTLDQLERQIRTTTSSKASSRSATCASRAQYLQPSGAHARLPARGRRRDARLRDRPRAAARHCPRRAAGDGRRRGPAPRRVPGRRRSRDPRRAVHARRVRTQARLGSQPGRVRRRLRVPPGGPAARAVPPRSAAGRRRRRPLVEARARRAAAAPRSRSSPRRRARSFELSSARRRARARPPAAGVAVACPARRSQSVLLARGCRRPRRAGGGGAGRRRPTEPGGRDEAALGGGGGALAGILQREFAGRRRLGLCRAIRVQR